MNQNRLFRLSFIFNITLFIPALIYLKEPGFNPLSFSELSILVILVFYFLAALKTGFTKKGKYFFLWSFILAVYVAIRLLTELSMSAIISSILHFKYMLLVLPTMALVDRRSENVLIYSLLMVGFVSQMPAIIMISNSPGTLLSLSGVGGFQRTVSVFPNPNMYGAFLTMIVLLTIYTQGMGGRLKKYFTRIVFISSSFLLILTFSRRSWLAYVFVLMIYAMWSKTKFGLFKAIGVLTVFSILLSFIDYSSIIERALTIFDSSYESNHIRQSQFNEIIDMLTSNFGNFLIGLGPGSIGPSSLFSNHALHTQVDNYWLLIMAEYGIIGIIFMFSIYFIGVYKSLKDVKGIEYNQRLILILAITTLFLIGFLGSTPISFPLSMYFWLFLGLLMKPLILSNG